MGYQAWANSAAGDNLPDLTSHHRTRLLGRARANLANLPDLMDELSRCLTEHDPVPGHAGKISGSPAPLRLDVLHLTDDRRKPGWEGEDPRLRKLEDRYGVAATLESWTRVVSEEIPEEIRPEMSEVATVRTEASVLIEVWPWITEQQWAEELADAIIGLTGRVRGALRIKPEPRYVCPQCGNRMYLQPGEQYMLCDEGHETTVGNLATQQRRRPPLSTNDIVAEFSITHERLYQWRKRRHIVPVRTEGRTHYWLPWDVFCLINPDIKDALDIADDMAAG